MYILLDQLHTTFTNQPLLDVGLIDDHWHTGQRSSNALGKDQGARTWLTGVIRRAPRLFPLALLMRTSMREV